MESFNELFWKPPGVLVISETKLREILLVLVRDVQSSM